MRSTKTQRFMLYTLGKWFEEANSQMKPKPLQVSISKTIFIELVLNAALASKQKRAIYKNLETLERKKLITYQNKEILISQRGEKLYREIEEEMRPYFIVNKKLQEKSATSYTKKVQTIFKREEE